MHLSFASRGSTPGTPPGNPRAPKGVGTVLVFPFSREEGELFSFENDIAGLRGHTHGICSRQCDRQGEKCFTCYHGRCVKMSKKCAKYWTNFFVIFANEKQILYFGLTIKG